MQGPVTNLENEKLHDLSFREIAVLVPIVILIFLIGVFPKAILLDKMHTSVENIVQIVETGGRR